MRNLLHQLVSGSSEGSNKSDSRGQVLTIRQSPTVPDQTVIHPDGYPADAPPLYCISTSASKITQMVITRGFPDPNNTNTIGFANVHLTRPIDLYLHGRPMSMKMSSMSGNFSLSSPSGQFKWKPSQMSGSSLYLYDHAGLKLAKYGSSGFPGFSEKQLELYVPCDEYFVELVILSAVVAKDVSKAIEEGVAEAVGAVAGA